jgi:outer membrane protein OmpA-like peptidoglycan-associated protein
MIKKGRTVLAGLAMAGAGGFAMPAQAGDGFYLGLEGGANFANKEKFKGYDFDGGLLGVPVEDGTVIARDKFKTGWLGGVTLGVATRSGLRPELEFVYREDKFDKGNVLPGAFGPTLLSTDNLHGEQNVEAAMLNLWLDLAKSSSVHPYIGGGGGYARFRIKNVQYGDTPELRRDHDDIFAWQAGAGLDFDLTERFDLGLGYRYFHTDKAKFNAVRAQPDAEQTTHYRSHAALLSMRYSFGASEPPPAAPPMEQVAVVPVQEPPAPPPPPPPPPCQIPEPGQPMTLEGCKAGDTLVLRGVNFEFDKATLAPNAKTILDQVTLALAARTDIKVEIAGHTDSKGSDIYNESLSRRRADSVRQYFIGHGIDASRMTTMGYGETRPVADNESDAGRELNRRVELKITQGGAGVTVAPPAGTTQ